MKGATVGSVCYSMGSVATSQAPRRQTRYPKVCLAQKRRGASGIDLGFVRNLPQPLSPSAMSPTYSKAMQCSNGCTHLSRPWFAMASCHQVVCSCRCKWGGLRDSDHAIAAMAVSLSLVTSKHKEFHGSPSCFCRRVLLGAHAVNALTYLCMETCGACSRVEYCYHNLQLHCRTRPLTIIPVRCDVL